VSFILHTNIELPNVERRGAPIKYPFAAMQPGHTFFVPLGTDKEGLPETEHAVVVRMRGAATRWRESNRDERGGMKFSVAPMVDPTTGKDAVAVKRTA
jgi:hypothetical protein